MVPAASPEIGAWQRCTGLWTVKADGSGSGFGHCHLVEADGKQAALSWEGDASGGTWERVVGTGPGPVKGNWKPGARFAAGFRITLWEGERAG